MRMENMKAGEESINENHSLAKNAVLGIGDIISKHLSITMVNTN